MKSKLTVFTILIACFIMSCNSNTSKENELLKKELELAKKELELKEKEQELQTKSTAKKSLDEAEPTAPTPPRAIKPAKPTPPKPTKPSRGSSDDVGNVYSRIAPGDIQSRVELEKINPNRQVDLDYEYTGIFRIDRAIRYTMRIKS